MNNSKVEPRLALSCDPTEPDSFSELLGEKTAHDPADVSSIADQPSLQTTAHVCDDFKPSSPVSCNTSAASIIESQKEGQEHIVEHASDEVKGSDSDGSDSEQGSESDWGSAAEVVPEDEEYFYYLVREEVSGSNGDQWADESWLKARALPNEFEEHVRRRAIAGGGEVTNIRNGVNHLDDDDQSIVLGSWSSSNSTRANSSSGGSSSSRSSSSSNIKDLDGHTLENASSRNSRSPRLNYSNREELQDVDDFLDDDIVFEKEKMSSICFPSSEKTKNEDHKSSTMGDELSTQKQSRFQGERLLPPDDDDDDVHHEQQQDGQGNALKACPSKKTNDADPKSIEFKSTLSATRNEKSMVSSNAKSSKGKGKGSWTGKGEEGKNSTTVRSKSLPPHKSFIKTEEDGSTSSECTLNSTEINIARNTAVHFLQLLQNANVSSSTSSPSLSTREKNLVPSKSFRLSSPVSVDTNTTTSRNNNASSAGTMSPRIVNDSIKNVDGPSSNISMNNKVVDAGSNSLSPRISSRRSNPNGKLINIAVIPTKAPVPRNSKFYGNKDTTGRRRATRRTESDA